MQPASLDHDLATLVVRFARLPWHVRLTAYLALLRLALFPVRVPQRAARRA